MKRVVLAAFVAASMIPAAAALACGKDCGCNHDKTADAAKPGGTQVADASKPAAADKFKMAKLDDAAAWQKASAATFFDANTPEFREKNGIVPGAKLLTNAVSYDVAKELPAKKDSKLVFYCANTMCMASHKAAERAAEAGYTDVSVMGDGLQGWKNAGHPTAAIPRS